MDDRMNVAAEIAMLRGDMNTRLAEIAGQLGLIAQSQALTKEELEEIASRVKDLEERRWPLGPMAAVSGAMSVVVGVLAVLVE